MAGGENVKRQFSLILAMLLIAGPVSAVENETIGENGAKVFIREHPQTGKPFVSLRKEGDTQDPFKGFVKREFRPDYRMLDAKTKSGDVPYDGPVSDRRKVYVFAATMMTLGVAGGLVTVAMPAGAAAAGAGGGTGLLGTGAVAVAAGTVGTVALRSHLTPGEENYIHEATTHAVTSDPTKLSLGDVLREIDAKEKTSEIQRSHFSTE
jgi:hypothetical protein